MGAWNQLNLRAAMVSVHACLLGGSEMRSNRATKVILVFSPDLGTLLDFETQTGPRPSKCDGHRFEDSRSISHDVGVMDGSMKLDRPSYTREPSAIDVF